MINKRSIVILVILLTGCALTAGAFITVRNRDRLRLSEAFNRAAEIRYALLKREIESDMQALSVLKSYYSFSGKISRAEFHAFTTPLLMKNPSIQALEWIPRIPYDRRDYYETAAKKDGFPGFQISEYLTQGKMACAARKEEYFPVYFVEPYHGNELALGFDLASNLTRRAPLEGSRDSGDDVATGRITLVQERANQAGFLVFSPIYEKGMPCDTVPHRREWLTGFVLGVFRIGDMVDKSLAFLAPEGIDVYLYDRSSPKKESLLYSHTTRQRSPLATAPEGNATAREHGLRYTRVLNVAGREWAVECLPTAEFIAGNESSQPWEVLMIGLLSTVFLTGFLQVIFKRSEKLQIANEQLKHQITEREAAEEKLRIHINELRKMEEELLESRLRLEQIFAFLPDATMAIDLEGRVIAWNRVMEELTGIPASAMLGRGDYEYAIPFYGKRRPLLADLVISGNDEYSREYERMRKEGNKLTGETKSILKCSEEHYFSGVAAPLLDSSGKMIGAIEHIHDITKLRQAEERLKESEARYRALSQEFQALMNCFPDALTLLSPDLGVLWANPVSGHLIGAEAGDLIGRHCYQMRHGVDVPCADCIVRDTFATGEQGYKVKAFGVHASDRMIELRTVPIKDDSGHVLKVFEIAREITEQKKSEEALRQSENLLHRIFEAIPDLLSIIDRDFRIVRSNWQGGYGYVDKTIRNSNPYCYDAYYPGQGKPCGKCHVLQVFQSGGPVTSEKYNPHIGLVEIRAFPIFDEAGEVVMVAEYIRDITEHRKREEEMRRAQKLDSLGVLAGGIAHDFNNLLTGILGSISMAKLAMNPDDKVYVGLDTAEKAIRRASDLTQQLLTFSKGGVPVRKMASIEQIVSESASFMLRGSNVKCKFIIPETVWPIEVDEGQISQVINNLVINADQAMPEGGKIKICIENLFVGPNEIPALAAGKYVRVAIEDHGTGISEGHLQKIFDPYFTTKQKGSGLGLATVYSIIKSHNGYIKVDSKVGAGSIFHVYLPASDKEIVAADRTAEEPLSGSGKILIMDDEEIIREVASGILEHFGYEAVACSEGNEAIELYGEAKRTGKPFAAVLMDLTIPGGMGGKETMRMLLAMDDKAIGIVSSGYCNDPILANYRDYGFNGVVKKPYDILELGKVLHELLPHV
ncbi:MAG TPA: CHASE domain-containing protein [Geobacteraceae bacterium]|nr:CHASE domain-containing protein [Geobacteraceae bacterium]